MPDDVHAASGAYALSALPEPERLAFERHLEECAACRREVRDFRAVAAELAVVVEEDPPASLRRRVLAVVAGEDSEVAEHAAAAQRATRELLGARTRQDVVDVGLDLVERLGGWVVPADLADDRALPLDIGLGSGAPLLPAAEPGSSAMRALEQYLPQFVEDARRALEMVVRVQRDARHESGDGRR